jgi:hypothetical protein
MDERVILLGLETMRILAAWDKEKEACGQKFITPEIISQGTDVDR